jgi:peptidoglycan/LPS O-acetylase OafA/YrhL
LKIALNQLAIYGHFPPVVVYFIRMMQMESMSLGALVALLFFKSIPLLNNHNILRLFQYTSGTLILTIVFLNKEIESILAQFGIYEKSSITLLNALVFACFIGSIALRNKMNKILDHKWLNWCGEISYGIYMYHLLVVTTIWGALSPLHLSSFWSTIILQTGSLSLTLIIAGLSKKYFEDPILKFKNSLK